MRDEEQVRTSQTPHIKPQTHKQRRTATEEPFWNVLSGNLLGA